MPPGASGPGAPLPAAIGRYQVESVIGRGAMGIVFKAHDPAIDRKVAIKLVRADLLDSEDRADFLERFRREAQAAGRCAHPNIIAVYDFSLHDGNPFIAMEYLESTSLAQVLSPGQAARQPVAVPRALHIMRQVLAALGAAHRAGVIHRDIKPANILLAAGDLTKVTDFGVARLDRSDITQTGSMIGTLSYMSPEQCRGDPVDARSDLFSAASVLFEALTGERAFPGRTETQVIQTLLGTDPAAICEGAGRMPEQVAAVLRRALAKDPAMRYATAEEFSAALADAGSGMPPGLADDGTLIEMRRAAPPELPPAEFAPAVLATIERRLAHYMGPIARHLVASAARGADSLETLYATLASRIESEADRKRFLGDTAGKQAATATGQVTVTKPGAPATSAVDIAADTLEAARRELTRHIGPIAPLLVRKALQKAGSEFSFWNEVAGHIETEAERKVFLRRFAPEK
jgi:serine/threonine-protein kinase